jgi:phage recombination protein Bet
MSESKINRDKLWELRDTICPNMNQDEFNQFWHMVERSQLDPLARQIYAIRRGGKLTVTVGIDGFRLIADRTGVFGGMDDVIFDNEENPKKATITVYKFVQGVRCATTASARMAEYNQNNTMWRRMPCTMLGKVAESLALRKAFPAELSGLYTEDEMAKDDSKPQEEQQSPPDNPATIRLHRLSWMSKKWTKEDLTELCHHQFGKAGKDLNFEEVEKAFQIVEKHADLNSAMIELDRSK